EAEMVHAPARKQEQDQRPPQNDGQTLEGHLQPPAPAHFLDNRHQRIHVAAPRESWLPTTVSAASRRKAATKRYHQMDCGRSRSSGARRAAVPGAAGAEVLRGSTAAANSAGSI